MKFPQAILDYLIHIGYTHFSVFEASNIFGIGQGAHNQVLCCGIDDLWCWYNQLTMLDQNGKLGDPFFSLS